ncbi:MAG: PEP-CTERM sorting domain-containing protein [Methanoregulaceae archaeon]|nr:PEP-CTERM sorting domain-containing protein [Methanoregulaceae archaeon]
MNLFKTSLLIAASLGVAASASADILFSQTTNGADGVYSDALSTNGGQFYGQTVADDFTVGAPGWNVTTIRFWGFSENAFLPDLSNFSDWEVNIMSPLGTTVEGGIVPKAGFTITQLGASIAGGPEYMFELATNFNLAAGNYHLNIGSINVASQDDAWAWSTSSQGNGTYSYSFFDTMGWQSEMGNLAFEFEGTAVPEPATMAALGLGVAAMLRRRRK